MKLLLTLCLAWTLLYTAESLHCHVCTNEKCSNTTSVQCPASSTVCKTVTSVTEDGAVTVKKECSSPLSCFTKLGFETELSVNLGYTRNADTQICCITDNCNFQTLATPSSFTNGKVCRACASPADSLARTCNATLDCVGAEDSCFSGNTTSNAVLLGCVTRYLCSAEIAVLAMLTDSPVIKCGAPWGASISAVLMSFALTLREFLV